MLYFMEVTYGVLVIHVLRPPKLYVFRWVLTLLYAHCILRFCKRVRLVDIDLQFSGRDLSPFLKRLTMFACFQSEGSVPMVLTDKTFGGTTTSFCYWLVLWY